MPWFQGNVIIDSETVGKQKDRESLPKISYSIIREDLLSQTDIGFVYSVTILGKLVANWAAD